MRREEHFVISPSRPKGFFLGLKLVSMQKPPWDFHVYSKFQVHSGYLKCKDKRKKMGAKSYSESSHRIWLTFTLATLTEWKTKNPIARSSVIHLHLTRFISMLKIFYITFPEGEYLRNEMLGKLCPVSLCYL